MSLTFIPPWITPDSEEFDLVDDATSVFRPELAPGVAQRQSFGAPRWKLTRRHTVRQTELALLLACLVDAEGQYNTLHTKMHWLRRGSFPAVELLSNKQFESGTTGWTSSNAEVTLSVTDRSLRAYRSGGVNDVTIRANSFTTVNGDAYGGRAFVREGLDTPNMSLRLGTAAGGSEIAQGSAVSEQGIATVSGVATGTTTHFSILDDNGGKSAGSFSEFVYTSASRVARVDGASQTGTYLAVKNLPASTNGLLLANDWVSINGQLLMVTMSLNSDSSGEGTLRFKPALFQSPADNTPIFILDPFGKFLVTNLRVSNRYGSDAIVTYNLEEVYEL